MSIYQHANETYLKGTLNLIDQLYWWNFRSKDPQDLKDKYFCYLRETQNKINSIARISPNDFPLWCTAIASMAVELIHQKKCIEHEDLKCN